MNIWGLITGLLMLVGLVAPAKPLPPAPIGITQTVITPAPKPSPKPAIGGIGAPVVTSFSAPQDMATAEESYYAVHGKYFQVIQGNQLPYYENTDVKSALGATLPTNTVINTYSGPYGDGYQIIIVDSLGTHARGYGPQAKDYTYEILTPISATSTQ